VVSDVEAMERPPENDLYKGNSYEAAWQAMRQSDQAAFQQVVYGCTDDASGPGGSGNKRNAQ
jgi:hypothetical protein